VGEQRRAKAMGPGEGAGRPVGQVTGQRPRALGEHLQAIRVLPSIPGREIRQQGRQCPLR
jgi:hypothetical protein